MSRTHNAARATSSTLPAPRGAEAARATVLSGAAERCTQARPGEKGKKSSAFLPCTLHACIRRRRSSRRLARACAHRYRWPNERMA